MHSSFFFFLIYILPHNANGKNAKTHTQTLARSLTRGARETHKTSKSHSSICLLAVAIENIFIPTTPRS